MKSTLRTRKTLSLAILAVLSGAGLAWAAPQQKTEPSSPYHFHRDDLLGTSLDLQIVASTKADADAAAQEVYAEIQRLTALLSTYDEKSEISKLNLTHDPVKVSPELLKILSFYEEYQQKTTGALSPQMGGLVALWTDAGKQGKLPNPEALAAAVKTLHSPAYRIDRTQGTVTRLTNQPLNINSIGKGYIIGQATEKARAKVPGVRGLLLSIGGDILAWGNATLATEKTPWPIVVANPAAPAENAPALTELSLQNMAVATSGTYERFVTIEGKKYSHLIDPRTGQTADAVLSATVIAPDNVSANALATASCILPPKESLALAKSMPGTECLLILADGQQLRSPGFHTFENKSVTTQPAKAAAWPNGNQFTVSFTIDPQNSPKSHRPYVAVWVEDENGKFLRTIDLWANKKQRKYLRDLLTWWIASGSRKVKDPTVAITRATRQAGHYMVTWDGRDAEGNPLTPGKFKIRLEVAFEDGEDHTSNVIVDCTQPTAEAKLETTPNFHDAQIIYGPPEKK